VTTGEIEPAENPDAEWLEPLPHTPGIVAGSEQLRRLREYER
jgi:hypothetical protein